MFLWDNIGETRICFDGADAAGAGLAAWLDACTVPIAMHDHARAGILGTATLLHCGGRHLLLTAAHLFDSATSSGNWLIPERASGHLLSLEGAQVQFIQGADIALIDLTRTPARPRLWRARAAIPASLALRARFPVHRHKQHGTTPYGTTYCLAGYPAAWSRFERGYLAAKRLTITTTGTATGTTTGTTAGTATRAATRTTARPEAETAARQRHDSARELRCLYGRTAERSDGQVIHTPALEGMSGAAIWEVERANGSAVLHLAGVQSAFMHSRYLRGDAAGACDLFSRR